MSALEIKNLHKNFGGVRAVDGLSFVLTPGKITGIIGPNGSGKSTLTNVLSGMAAIDSGVLIIGGEQITGLKSYEAIEFGITRTFQEVRLFEQITVLDNILVVLTERGVFKSLRSARGKMHEVRAQEILERIGLWDKRHQLARQLSYGQRKLLEIGRTLAIEADIYLFDEPFAGLAASMVKMLSEILIDLRAKGKVVVLIEHNMELIRSLADHIVVMDNGQLLAEGAPASVLSQHNVIQAYLGK